MFQAEHARNALFSLSGRFSFNVRSHLFSYPYTDEYAGGDWLSGILLV